MRGEDLTGGSAESGEDWRKESTQREPLQRHIVLQIEFQTAGA